MLLLTRYYYGDPVRVIRLAKRVAGMGDMRNAYRAFGWKT